MGKGKVLLYSPETTESRFKLILKRGGAVGVSCIIVSPDSKNNCTSRNPTRLGSVIGKSCVILSEMSQMSLLSCVLLIWLSSVSMGECSAGDRDPVFIDCLDR